MSCAYRGIRIALSCLCSSLFFYQEAVLCEARRGLVLRRPLLRRDIIEQSFEAREKLVPMLDTQKEQYRLPIGRSEDECQMEM